jgi:hypothetical protein
MIYKASAVANLRGSVLPEIVAQTGPSPPMIPQQNRACQMFCPRQKGRE